MAIYTVHAPADVDVDVDATNAGRIRFIRDGFAVWALILPGVWFLWHRLWLAFLIWLAAMVGFELLGREIGDTPAAILAALFGLFLAIEARDIERWTLERRGWRLLGVVEGGGVEIAERRFFEAWLGGRKAEPADEAIESDDQAGTTVAAAPTPQTVPSRAAIVPRTPRPAPSGVIGLFPESGGRG